MNETTNYIPFIVSIIVAFLGLAGGYFLSLLKMKHEERRIAKLEELSLLREVVSDVTDYAAAITYFAAIRRSVSCKDNLKENETEFQNQSEIEFLKAQNRISNAKALLTILGASRAYDVLVK
jgi:hypothetical protein